MLNELEKELVATAELFDELNVRLVPVLQDSTTVDSPRTTDVPPPSPPRSVVCARVEELHKQVINLRGNMSETLSRVDLP